MVITITIVVRTELSNLVERLIHEIAPLAGREASELSVVVRRGEEK